MNQKIYLVGLPDTQGGMSYLTTGEGDPPRCYTRKHAREFKTTQDAKNAILKALKETSPFKDRKYEILRETP